MPTKFSPVETDQRTANAADRTRGDKSPIELFGPIFLVASIIAHLPASVTFAGGFYDEPVGVRISLAKERLMMFTDTLARQANSAFPVASSLNPANDDFIREPPVDYGGYVLPITSDIFFENGAFVTGFGAVGSIRLPEAGSITAVIVRADSHEGDSNDGDHYALRTNELFLGYSHKLTRFLAIGGEVNLTESSLNIDDRQPGLSVNSESDIVGAGFELGATMAFHETFLVGLHGGVKWDRVDTGGEVVVTGGPRIPIDESDTNVRSRVRGGIGWLPAKEIGIYADVEYIHFENDLGTTDLGRGYLGAEFKPNDDIAIRLGTVIDSITQMGVSTGLGYYGLLEKGIVFESAYSYNQFPEVKREFGRAHTISLSIVVLF